MKTTNEVQDTYIAAFTGYSKTKKYRVNIQQVEADKDTIFTYFADMEDLREVVKNYVDELSNEEGCQIYLKVNKESENGSSTVDCRVVISFENSTHLFYPPEPQYVYTKEGKYIITVEEYYDIRVAYSMIIHEEDYQIKILELFASLDKNENASLEAPTAILFISFDPQIYMWEAYPLKVLIKYEPKHEFIETEIGERERILQFNNFIDMLSREDVLMAEKISKKNDRTRRI